MTEEKRIVHMDFFEPKHFFPHENLTPSSNVQQRPFNIVANFAPVSSFTPSKLCWTNCITFISNLRCFATAVAVGFLCFPFLVKSQKQGDMNLNGTWESRNLTESENVPRDVLGFGVSMGLGNAVFLGITLIFVTVLGFWFESLWHWRPENLPPGPRNVFELLVKVRSAVVTADVDIDLLSKILEVEYGKIFGWFSYLSSWVIIGDFDTLQNVSKNPAVQGRPPMKFLQMTDDGVCRGIAQTSGETWREIRRFTVSQLKNLGMAKRSRLDPIIGEQVEECVSLLRTKIGQPFSSDHFFDIPSVNILWEIISGQKFSLTDPEPQKLCHYLERTSKAWPQGLLLGRYPRFGARLLDILGMENPFRDGHKHFKTFVSKLFEKRLKSRNDENERNDDFAQAFFEKIEATKDVNSPFYGQLGYENFQEVIRDFFVAGSDTTSNTLSWTLLYLALHPEKQEKLQKEIDSVLGQRTPSLDDRSMMKYTEAVINETLRKSSLIPFGLPHASTQDTTIGKFHIPKGTMVTANVYAIHHCKETWGDPYVFRPERFLTEDETTLVKYEQLVPFGFGKRICPGMTLAYEEIFLFITRIFQEFSITWNPEEPKPDIKPRADFKLMPAFHTLIISQRTPPLWI